jgi:hypothetical protein
MNGVNRAAVPLCSHKTGPLELAHQIEQASLPSPRDEFLQCFSDGSFLGAFAADLEGRFDQLGIDREICRDVSTSTVTPLPLSLALLSTIPFMTDDCKSTLQMPRTLEEFSDSRHRSAVSFGPHRRELALFPSA